MAVKKTDKKPRVGDGTPGPGRPKGVANKNTKALKEMILGALDNKGGVAYLEQQAEENPTAFMTLIGKVLPMTVAGTGKDGEHLTSVTVKIYDGTTD